VLDPDLDADPCRPASLWRRVQQTYERLVAPR
jgi:hypothetical protein